MHGDREVSTKQLARQIDRKTVEPCDPAVAQKHTGYAVGGTSPFGTRKALPVYVERTVLDLDRIYINGGRRGLLVSHRARLNWSGFFTRCPSRRHCDQPASRVGLTPAFPATALDRCAG